VGVKLNKIMSYPALADYLGRLGQARISSEHPPCWTSSLGRNGLMVEALGVLNLVNR
jgi:hypothetical protein